MATNRDFLDYVLEQLSLLKDVTYRPMMGEYIIYCKDKIIGGIYDNRFLIKPCKAALEMMPEARMEYPYEGGKKMLLVEDLDDKRFLCDLINGMYDELPVTNKKKNKN